MNFGIRLLEWFSIDIEKFCILIEGYSNVGSFILAWPFVRFDLLKINDYKSKFNYLWFQMIMGLLISIKGKPLILITLVKSWEPQIKNACECELNRYTRGINFINFKRKIIWICKFYQEYND